MLVQKDMVDTSSILGPALKPFDLTSKLSTAQTPAEFRQYAEVRIQTSADNQNSAYQKSTEARADSLKSTRKQVEEVAKKHWEMSRLNMAECRRAAKVRNRGKNGRSTEQLGSTVSTSHAALGRHTCCLQDWRSTESGRSDYVTSRRNYWDTINKIFHDDDPKIAKAVADMKDAQTSLEKLTKNLASIAKVITAITSAVKIGGELAKMAG
jgi:hypothetical protein